MDVFTDIVNTRDIPSTHLILSKVLPSIFGSMCYNNEQLPFEEEVKQTEVGHLFEHVLLEYICELKTKLCEQNVEVSGVTNWDWRKEKRGTFHIVVTIGRADAAIFRMAMHKTIELVDMILGYYHSTTLQKPELGASPIHSLIL